jgi:hypothetical protein
MRAGSSIHLNIFEKIKLNIYPEKIFEEKIELLMIYKRVFVCIKKHESSIFVALLTNNFYKPDQ